MGTSTASKRDITKSKNEVKITPGPGPKSAYKCQPVEDRKSKGKRGKRGY